MLVYITPGVRPNLHVWNLQKALYDKMNERDCPVVVGEWGLILRFAYIADKATL